MNLELPPLVAHVFALRVVCVSEELNMPLWAEEGASSTKLSDDPRTHELAELDRLVELLISVVIIVASPFDTVAARLEGVAHVVLR